MKLPFDMLLVLGMLLCYGVGHIFAADRFVLAAGLLLVVFVVRLLGSSLTWLLGGR